MINLKYVSRQCCEGEDSRVFSDWQHCATLFSSQVSALSSRLLAIESDLQAERSRRRDAEAEVELLRSSLASSKTDVEERSAEVKTLMRRLDEEKDRCRESIAAHKR